MTDLPRLWLARLDGPLPPGTETWLDPSEMARLAGFVDPAERQRRRLAWALRRWALSQACPTVAEAAWRFVSGPHGKPRLAPQFAPCRLEHNLSHGGDFAAVLIARHPCGVDVEGAPGGLEGMEVVFGPAERAAILSHPRPTEAFLQHWVAKEAVLKAIGTGFATAPEHLSLALRPDGRTAALGYVEQGGALSPPLQVRLWPLPGGHWLATALEGRMNGLGPTLVPWQGAWPQSTPSNTAA